MAESSHVEAAEFRRTVALFATGIVVLSCETTSGEIQGMTVNSFTSISLEPPTILVSLKPGATSRMIAHQGRFGISVLDETQRAFSAHFSSRDPSLPLPDFTTRAKVPTLSECLAWFECALIKTVEIYDHSLYLAHVTACGRLGGEPLLYFGGQYRTAQAAAQ